ncbi:MAG: amino acid ABC transporter substrate-binding protein [Gammaproteobacteria bacterium]|nr:amino acid ABC transporter substrate-binding protein [Gammaproteobacteria bacterium]
MEKREFLKMVATGAVAGSAGALVTSERQQPPHQHSSVETIYDRVMRFGVIKCGYLVRPPLFVKDPNTGDFSGVTYELMQALGKSTGLNIEFTEEVGWSTMISGLKSGRYDMMATSVWMNASRAREVSFLEPLFYSGVGVFSRVDDQRFKSVADVNNSNVTIATIDGTTYDHIARLDFPQAKTLSLTQLNSLSEVLVQVETGKADVAIIESYEGTEYLHNNPGKLKDITTGKPIRYFGEAFMVPHKELAFSSMLNTALAELKNSGLLDDLLDKYQIKAGSFFETTNQFQSIQ